MPLRKIDDTQIPMPNEISRNDWTVGSTRYPNPFNINLPYCMAFTSSPILHDKDIDQEKIAVAQFLNEHMSGPFYTWNSLFNNRIIHQINVVIHNPDDKQKFEKAFKCKGWEFDNENAPFWMAVDSYEHIAAAYDHHLTPEDNQLEPYLYEYRNAKLATFRDAMMESMDRCHGPLNISQIESLMRKACQTTLAPA